MPCFDKKLEAARTEFESEHDGTKVRKGLNQFQENYKTNS